MFASRMVTTGSDPSTVAWAMELLGSKVSGPSGHAGTTRSSSVSKDGRQAIGRGEGRVDFLRLCRHLPSTRGSLMVFLRKRKPTKTVSERRRSPQAAV